VVFRAGLPASCKPDTQPSAPHQTSNLKTTARNTTGSNHCIIPLSSWWWVQWCPKHVEQAIRSAIKTSVASSWHFMSTYYGSIALNHRRKRIHLTGVIQILLGRSSLRLHLQRGKSLSLFFVMRKMMTLVVIMPRDQTINSDLYSQTYRTLQKSLTMVRLHKNVGEFLLEYDNAWPHTSLKPHEAITKLGWTVLPHPPYSPKPFPMDGICKGLQEVEICSSKTWGCMVAGEQHSIPVLWLLPVVSNVCGRAQGRIWA